MMLRIIALFFALNAFGGLDPLKTRNANLAKEKAENAIAANDFKTAIQAYNYLLDTLKIKDDKALLNLAHAHMRKADYNNAISRYTEAAKSSDNKIKSIASQQLGILQSERGNREEATAHFKNAIKYDPSNTQARFNYELMLKNKNKDVPKSEDQKQRKEEEKKNQEKKDQQKKDEQKKEEQKQDKKSDQENKEQGKGDKKDEGEKNKGEKENKEGKEGEKDEQKKNEDGKLDKNKEGDKKPEEEKNKSSKNKEDENSQEKGKADKASKKGEDKKKTETPNVSANKEQLQKMNMTEHQAKAILNAMRQGEVQYIQQMKRGGKHKNDKPKKDW